MTASCLLQRLGGSRQQLLPSVRLALQAGHARLSSTFSPLPNKAAPEASVTPSETGLYRLLSVKERALLAEQRQLTETSRHLSKQILPESSSHRIWAHSVLEDLQLEASFSVVVAGEFNAGKSTLINALLGFKLLESGALPTTDAITIVTSPTDKAASLPLGVMLHQVPDVPLLQDLTLIDTPGTNSAWMDHTERTLRLLPSADLILFVTSADRPFSESERQLLAGIQAYRKSIVIVVNKMDILNAEGGDHGKESKLEVVDFVTERSSELLGARPIVLPVSSRDALSSKLLQQMESNVWTRSNFQALESFLKESLTTQTKLKNKLVNPIGVAEGVMRECLDILHTQQDELQTDIATLHVLETQFAGWRTELASDLELFRQSTLEVVRKEGDRWNLLLNRMNILTFHYWLLVDNTQFQQEWEDTKRQVALHRQEVGWKEDLLADVREIAESVATRGRAQGQAVIEYLGKRPAVQNQSLVGSVTAASRFEDTRKNLEERLAGAVNGTLRDSDEAMENDEVQSFLWRTAAVSATLQTGAISSLAATGLEILDPLAGGFVASSLVLSSFACYTMGTSRISQYYQQKWADRATDLGVALSSICDAEVERVSRRILSGVGPYTRYVDTEKERIEHLQEECEAVCAATLSLRNRISKVLQS